MSDIPAKEDGFSGTVWATMLALLLLAPASFISYYLGRGFEEAYHIAASVPNVMLPFFAPVNALIAKFAGGLVQGGFAVGAPAFISLFALKQANPRIVVWTIATIQLTLYCGIAAYVIVAETMQFDFAPAVGCIVGVFWAMGKIEVN